jgi:hypothetical protein
MSINIKQISTGTFQSDPDYFEEDANGQIYVALRCIHENARVYSDEYSFSGVHSTYGQDGEVKGFSVLCPDCDNKELTDSEVEHMIDVHLANQEGDGDGPDD